jgi:hypothetical protein
MQGTLWVTTSSSCLVLTSHASVTTLLKFGFVGSHSNSLFIVHTFHVTPYPNDTQYCSLLAPPNQTSYEVTYSGTTLAEARLTIEF